MYDLAESPVVLSRHLKECIFRGPKKTNNKENKKSLDFKDVS